MVKVITALEPIVKEVLHLQEHVLAPNGEDEHSEVATYTAGEDCCMVSHSSGRYIVYYGRKGGADQPFGSQFISSNSLLELKGYLLNHRDDFPNTRLYMAILQKLHEWPVQE